MISDIKLNQFEIVRTVGKHMLTDTVFKIRIPKLMISPLKNKQRQNFNKAIFVNAPDCMVYPSSTVITQNYITVPKSTNCNLGSVAQLIDDDWVIPENTPLLCACLYGSTNNMCIVDTCPFIDSTILDTSVYTPYILPVVYNEET